MRSLLLCSLVVASAPAFAEGPLSKDPRKVSDFGSLAVAGGLEVELVAGAPGVVLEGPQADLSAVEVEVSSGVLHVRRRANQGNPAPVKVRISTGRLQRIEAAGGVKLRFDGSTVQPALALALAGGIDLAARGLELNRLDLVASGGVSAVLAGKASTSHLTLSAGVDLDAKALEAGEVELSASAGCDVDLRASKAVRGVASTGTSVRLAGHPKSELRTSLGADVQLVD